jgi:hypothetical protein
MNVIAVAGQAYVVGWPLAVSFGKITPTIGYGKSTLACTVEKRLRTIGCHRFVLIVETGLIPLKKRIAQVTQHLPETRVVASP